MIPADARSTAIHVLNVLDKGRKTLDTVMEETDPTIASLSKRDRALLHALIYGVLRWRARLDWIIAHFSKVRSDRIDPRILNILRIGLFQIVFLNKIPVSAAVNTSVEMAKSFAPLRVARFVNALLRKSAIEHQSVPFPDPDEDPIASLATKKSFPRWMIARWLHRYGFEETEKLCDAINTIPPITLRTNTLKTTRENLMTALKDDVENLEFTTYSPDGMLFYRPKTSISESTAFKAGWFQVQDEAAQLVSGLLNPKAGETVLDACAGLGGKTGHIAQLMRNKGSVLGMDKDEKKLFQLQSAMHRLGISIVKTRTHNLEVPLDAGFFALFDRILLDAPCSGLGVLRRNPDIKWQMSEEKLAFLSKRQVKFLDHLADAVKPSGVLVYSVCSTEPEENENVVKTFLNKHPEFVIHRTCSKTIERNDMEYRKGTTIGSGKLPIKICCLMDQKGFLRTLPHRDNMDGFFAVCFKRKN
jgi:16S rRNA (cytosine967-C5)-methyltransferase